MDFGHGVCPEPNIRWLMEIRARGLLFKASKMKLLFHQADFVRLKAMVIKNLQQLLLTVLVTVDGYRRKTGQVSRSRQNRVLQYGSDEDPVWLCKPRICREYFLVSAFHIIVVLTVIRACKPGTTSEELYCGSYHINYLRQRVGYVSHPYICSTKIAWSPTI